MKSIHKALIKLMACSLLFLACTPKASPPVPTAASTNTVIPAASPSAVVPPTTTPALITGGEIPCYAGPGPDYEVAATLGIGIKAEILAKDSGGEYWVIQIPGASDRCWIEARYATILGTQNTIPTFPVNSIPTKNIVRIPALGSLEARASCVPIKGNRAAGTPVTYRILIRLSWPSVQGEDGLRLYKESEMITELAPNTTEFDYWLVPEPDMPLNLKLSIVAFDKNGPSEPKEATVRVRGVCKGL